MQHQAIDSHHGELHEDEDHNHGGEDNHEEENNPEWRNEQFMAWKRIFPNVCEIRKMPKYSLWIASCTENIIFLRIYKTIKLPSKCCI